MSRRVALMLGVVVLVVAIAAVAATLVARGGKKQTLPFTPAVLGGQPRGAVVLAREDSDLAVALALEPQPGGLLAVVTVLGQDGAGASGLTTRVDVTTATGATVGATARPGALGTYQAVLATRGRPVSARVTIDGPGSSGRPIRFQLPAAWPPKPAGALMQEVDRAYGRLRTLVIHERLASSPTHVLNSVYRAVAPHSLGIDSSNGLQAIVIGERRWDRSAGGAWKQSEQSPPVKATSPYWSGIVQDPVLLGSTTIRGRPVWLISFAAPQIPAFFRLDVDKRTRRVLDLEMTASAHFMHHRYGPFDSPLRITPPR
jgi:hypothetical protein